MQTQMTELRLPMSINKSKLFFSLFRFVPFLTNLTPRCATIVIRDTAKQNVVLYLKVNKRAYYTCLCKFSVIVEQGF